MTSAAKLRLSTFGAWHDDDVPCSPRTCLPARRMSAAGPSIMRYYSSLRRSPSNQLAVPTFELPHKENIEVMKRSLRVAALVALCGESVQTFHVSLLLPAIRFSVRYRQTANVTCDGGDRIYQFIALMLARHDLFSFSFPSRSKPTKCGRILHSSIAFSGVFASTHEWASTHIHSLEHGVLYGTAKPRGSAFCTFDQ